MIAMDLAELLIGLGHDICAIVRSEDDAVDAATRMRPDLMIVDAGLHEGSGVAAVHRILAQEYVAHLFVTGDPRGVNDFASDAIIVPKPYSVPQLLSGIRRARQAAIIKPPASTVGRPAAQ